MFKAVATGETLETFLDNVSVLVDECKIRTEADGLKVTAVDPANVGMVNESLDPEAFESYEADGGKIGVNLSRLEEVIGFADSDDLVTLELDEATRKLEVSVDGLEATIALIDPDSIRQEPDIPDLDLPAEPVVEGRDIDQSVKAADMVSDHIALGVDADENLFYVDAEGDTDDIHLELEEDDLVDLTAGYAHSLFSLEYLKDMNKAIPKDTEVTLELGEEFPVKLHFNFADGAGHCTFMLAPRIQN